MNKLGLDLSTNVMGFSILNENNEIITCGYHKNEKEELNDRAEFFYQKINDILKQYQIDEIHIEDALLTYCNSSYNTVTKLLAINAIIVYLLEKNNNIKVIKYFPLSARKFAFGTSLMTKEDVYEREKGYPNVNKSNWKKHQIYLRLKNLYPNIDDLLEWSYDKKNDIKKLKTQSYDVCDAIVMGIQK